MADPDQSSSIAPVSGIAEPHRSTVNAILDAALQGVFRADEADRLIERIRALATTSHSPIRVGLPPSNSPNRTLL
jgi:hypothetical protein